MTFKKWNFWVVLQALNRPFKDLGPGGLDTNVRLLQKLFQKKTLGQKPKVLNYNFI
jgi:hypothetical protein